MSPYCVWYMVALISLMDIVVKIINHLNVDSVNTVYTELLFWGLCDSAVCLLLLTLDT